MPSSNQWVVRFSVNADESTSRNPSDNVRVILGGVTIGVYSNTPARAGYGITYRFGGATLPYRFEFNSGNATKDLHQTVTAGVITESLNVRVAGTVNGFGQPPSLSSPSRALGNLLLMEYAHRRFDFDQVPGVNSVAGNTAFGHTFANIPPDVEGATLWLKLTAGTGTTATDTMDILFTDTQNSSSKSALAWHRSLGQSADDPGLLKNTPWVQGDVAIAKLDLSALPMSTGGTTNLLPLIRAKGFFDIVIENDTGVDYALLDMSPKHGALNSLEISAVDISTEFGKAYQLQSSEDLTTWVNLGDSFFGDGERGVKLMSTPSSKQRFYRLVTTNE